MKASVTLYCKHVSKSAVRCNKYIELRVDNFDMAVREVIEESHWSIVDEEPRCPDHS